jgi:hypothetical protein
MILSPQRLATVLAALRYYQDKYDGVDKKYDDIATNNGRLPGLPPDKIDDLCQQLNMDGTAAYLRDLATNLSKSAASSIMLAETMRETAKALRKLAKAGRP